MSGKTKTGAAAVVEMEIRHLQKSKARMICIIEVRFRS